MPHFNYTHDQSFSPHGVLVIICAENSSVGQHWHLSKETQNRIRSPTERATVLLPIGSRILTHNPMGYAHSNHRVSTGAFVRRRLSNPVRNHLDNIQFQSLLKGIVHPNKTFAEHFPPSEHQKCRWDSFF